MLHPSSLVSSTGRTQMSFEAFNAAMRAGRMINVFISTRSAGFRQGGISSLTEVKFFEKALGTLCPGGQLVFCRAFDEGLETMTENKSDAPEAKTTDVVRLACENAIINCTNNGLVAANQFSATSFATEFAILTGVSSDGIEPAVAEAISNSRGDVEKVPVGFYRLLSLKSSAPPAEEKSEPEQDKRKRGVFHRYDVSRVDGKDEPGGKHEFCDLFVLDLNHDPFSLPAALAYAQACGVEYPALARDLRKKVRKVQLSLKTLDIMEKLQTQGRQPSEWYRQQLTELCSLALTDVTGIPTRSQAQEELPVVVALRSIIKTAAEIGEIVRNTPVTAGCAEIDDDVIARLSGIVIEAESGLRIIGEKNGQTAQT